MTDLNKLGQIARKFNRTFEGQVILALKDEMNLWNSEAIMCRLSAKEREDLTEIGFREGWSKNATPEDSIRKAEILARAACHAGERGKNIGRKFLPAHVRTPENKAALKEIAPFFARAF